MYLADLYPYGFLIPLAFGLPPVFGPPRCNHSPPRWSFGWLLRLWKWSINIHAWQGIIYWILIAIAIIVILSKTNEKTIRIKCLMVFNPNHAFSNSDNKSNPEARSHFYNIGGSALWWISCPKPLYPAEVTLKTSFTNVNQPLCYLINIEKQCLVVTKVNQNENNQAFAYKLKKKIIRPCKVIIQPYTHVTITN